MPQGSPRRAAERAELGLAADTIALLFVSNNYRLKGLHDLIDALPRVAKSASGPVRLLVAGRGRPRAFERLAARRGVRHLLLFCGHRDSLLDLYAAADVLVHPSYYDAFGLVCLEAMACGLPVVVSRNSGVSEIMKDGDGSVFVDMPCSREALADAVSRAAAPAFRERAKTIQWQLAQQHPIEKNHQAMVELYTRIAKQTSAGETLGRRLS